MILSALTNYYEQLLREHPEKVGEPGWTLIKVTHLLVLSSEGELVDIISAPDKSGFQKRVPERVKRSSGIAPNLLADNSSYLLGIDKKGKPKRSRACFEAAKAAHLDLLAGIDSPAASALRGFFETWDVDAAPDSEALLRAGEDVLAGGNLSFVLGQQDLADDEQIAAAWDARRASDSEDSTTMRCLVTGEEAPIARLHPAIKGVFGAQAVASLVGFNAHAFESYGHDDEQGLNAPVSEKAAFAYTTALNYLIGDPLHHTRIGNTTVVYWSEHGDRANAAIMSLLMGGNPSDFADEPIDETVDRNIDAVMEALAHGKEPNLEGVDLSSPFYVLGLDPNAARISVRFFVRNEFGTILRNIQRHYGRLAVAHAPWERDYIAPYWLVRAAENPNAKNPVVTSELGGALMRAILDDAPYPESLYSNILLRIRATRDNEEKGSRKVSYARAAFIKAYLIKNARLYEEGTMETVDAERDEDAYTLGRLFWMLEDLQNVANPEINATIADKYFDTACATPALVFPTLVGLSKKHLRKVKRDKPGIAYSIDAKLTKVLSGIESFPKSLSNVAQGDFILGYYHQKHADIQERIRISEEKKAASANDAEEQ